MFYFANNSKTETLFNFAWQWQIDNTLDIIAYYRM